MKVTLGWLAFGLGLLFAAGQYFGMVQEAWFPRRDTSGFVAFFGFGLPMIVLGLLAAGLWSERRLRTYLGWTSVVIALVWGISLLILVGGRAGLLPTEQSSRMADEWLGLFAGFLASMLVCGASGVMLLSEQSSVRPEPPADSPFDDVLREVKSHHRATP